MVKIKYLGYYSDMLKKKEEEVSIDTRVKVKDLLAPKVLEDKPIILINGTPSEAEDEVCQNDTITIIPPMDGG